MISFIATLGIIATLNQAAADGAPLFGHQDDLMYGHTWNSSKENDHSFVRSDVYATAGAYPYILGLDLGELEVDHKANLDGNDFSLMREAVVKHHERGGIVTISWHARNPLTGGDAWDVSNKKVVMSILPSGEKHEYFLGWLDKVADFIMSLKDSEGQQIPVIFRPWHEHTGSWFWWGTDLCTSEEYNSLWRMTYDRIVKEKGVKGIVWAISPGASPKGFEKWESRYPGDDYVDIIGLDCYCSTHLPASIAFKTYRKQVRNCLKSLENFAKARGKILAMTETGFEGLNYEKWWTEVLTPTLKGIPVAYVLVWRNTDERPLGEKHYYAPWPGGPSEADFRQWANGETVKFLGK